MNVILKINLILSFLRFIFDEFAADYLSVFLPTSIVAITYDLSSEANVIYSSSAKNGIKNRTKPQNSSVHQGSVT